jgi:uncharacterized protein YjbJ (UPF0337 family)
MAAKKSCKQSVFFWLPPDYAIGPGIAMEQVHDDARWRNCQKEQIMRGRTEHLPVAVTRLEGERLRGAINEIAGRAKRQMGEWTGDSTAQVEGLAQEMKGRAQLAWCGVKDALRTLQAQAGIEEDISSGKIHDSSLRTGLQDMPEKHRD